jgi:hypothetical protein
MICPTQRTTLGAWALTFCVAASAVADPIGAPVKRVTSGFASFNFVSDDPYVAFRVTGSEFSIDLFVQISVRPRAHPRQSLLRHG